MSFPERDPDFGGPPPVPGGRPDDGRGGDGLRPDPRRSGRLRRGDAPEEPAAGAAPAARPPRLDRPRSFDGPGNGRPGRRPGPGGPGSDGRPPARRLAVAAGLAALVAGLIWVIVALFQPLGGGGKGPVAVVIPRGAGVSKIGHVLADHGVVSSAFVFDVRATLAGHRSDLKPGAYTLRRGMGYAAAMRALAAGPPRNVVAVTLPEGPSRRELAPIVRRAGLHGSYLSATTRSSLLDPRRYGARHAASLEGFLFPSTYELKGGAPAQALVAKQLTAFKQAFARVDLRAARRKQLTPYDVLVVASMVEREAEVNRDRPLIASVIYNRLRRGMTLGIDATIRYATGDWSGPLTAAELMTPSPYNTRTHRGLPPGPIGNPGLSSIQAAAHPASTDYLYYVVKPCGHGEHVFARSFAEFQRDQQRYNAARTQQGGRSPVSCR